MSPDGVIEGLRYDDETQFIVGVQWHAEWEPEKHTLSGALYTAFAEAARAARDAPRFETEVNRDRWDAQLLLPRSGLRARSTSGPASRYHR